MEFKEMIRQIDENYRMGLLTGLEALWQTIDVLHKAGETIEDADARDAWMETVYGIHRDNEKLNEACFEIMGQIMETL